MEDFYMKSVARSMRNRVNGYAVFLLKLMLVARSIWRRIVSYLVSITTLCIHRAVVVCASCGDVFHNAIYSQTCCCVFVCSRIHPYSSSAD